MQPETMLNLRWDIFASHLSSTLDYCYEKQHFVDLSLGLCAMEQVNSFSDDKIKVLENLSLDKNVTEEEFSNFMQRVTEVEKIVKKLNSNDCKDQEEGKILADYILEGNKNFDSKDADGLKIKTNRTVINKSLKNETDGNEMPRKAFMKTMEADARKRSEDRKVRNERADTFKRIGNGAFGVGDFEKAVTYYGKAIEQRKDSAVIWNNRALSYIRLGLYEKALQDCEWALKVNDSNIKALLNSAKCYAYLGNNKKRDEFIQLAKERVPKFSNYIKDFEKALKENPNDEEII
ncbi:tetratricopeptide repeat protein 12-like isoform X1 [Microplitis demolitor]|uniref:tetratricopeptide repeat protein 12-like isoform X1 n=2 Tax=Microplitis demolitor TaxID=69319 RepID=UPI0004CD66B8|nr:tetratricopeptide repeat protein 12-like isoform X1 [Microplitis demolitor]